VEQRPVAHNIIEGGSASDIVQAGVVHGDVHIGCATPSAPVVPRQIPVGSGPFVGRGALVAQLDGIVKRRRPYTPAIALLVGMAGVGKTALAVRWALGCASAFPDAATTPANCGNRSANQSCSQTGETTSATDPAKLITQSSDRSTLQSAIVIR